MQVRLMQKDDIQVLFDNFSQQGWNKPLEQFEKYYKEQRDGFRLVFIGLYNDEVAGYCTLLPTDVTGPFANKDIPTLCDFNVFIKYQNKGVGTAILNKIETYVKEYSDVICLGVGLHSGYGSAQRMYVKRGYIPDGSGVWYREKQLDEYAPCNNDDDLILYMSKIL